MRDRGAQNSAFAWRDPSLQVLPWLYSCVYLPSLLLLYAFLLSFLPSFCFFSLRFVSFRFPFVYILLQWFMANERTIATTIGSLAGVLGVSLNYDYFTKGTVTTPRS